jgi:hypothetical protein
VENFIAHFFLREYSEPEGTLLSSSEVITAAPVVHVSCEYRVATQSVVCSLPGLLATRNWQPATDLPGVERSFILLLRIHPIDLSQEQVLFDAKADIPTQPASPLEDARISYAHEDQGRTGGDLPAARQRSQAGFGEARLP